MQIRIQSIENELSILNNSMQALVERVEYLEHEMAKLNKKTEATCFHCLEKFDSIAAYNAHECRGRKE